RFVNKGVGRPAFSQELRAEAIASLQCVDFAAINQWPTAIEAIYLLRPHVFAKGSEFKNLQDTIGHVSAEAKAVRECGGEIAFTEDITFSSSALINQYVSSYSEEVRRFLAELAAVHPAEHVLRYFNAAATKRVLVVGETIIDEYHYCE